LKLEYRRGALGACATIEFALAMMSLALASLSVACLYCTWAMNYGILLCNISRIAGFKLLACTGPQINDWFESRHHSVAPDLANYTVSVFF
jgi:hypothetical protein